MTATVRVFSSQLYPRAALENAARAFEGVCPVQLEDAPSGVAVSLEAPEDADADLMGEFSNLALVTAIELHLAAPR